MTKFMRRRYGRTLKLEIVRRMAAGESAAALAREYGIGRTNNLYRWSHEIRDGGEGALRDGAGRPSWLEQHSGSSEVRDLAGARRRIAELERKVGQQQVDLDFFEGALRRIEASRRPSEGLGATKSLPRSRR